MDNNVSMLISAKDNATSTIDKIKKETKNLNDEVKRANKELEKTNFGKWVDGLNTAVLSAALFKAGESMIEFTKKSSDYIETLNVLDVAFNNDTASIREFTSAISETLNLDDSTLIKSVSSFKTLANSMQYANDVGTEFAKTLTQMTLDISSLYNLDFKKAQSALQYAVQGQGKTLKATTGASVLETTIQTTLDALGVDAYVEDMNDAEKAMARVITISYQLQNSQGDLARTIESPANQFRVLGEQISLLARNIGNILLPAIGALLPYLNAVLIVINTILKSISVLVGFDESSWDFFTEGANSFDDLGASIGGVGDSAEKTKRKLQGLREFDKLNVLRTPTTSSSGGAGGGGGAGAINPNLLNAFNDIFSKYNTNLDGIKTKASSIAEQILKWLGFSKEIDPITGKIRLKYLGLGTTVKNIWESFKKLSPTLKFIVALGIGVAASKLYTILNKLFKLIGTTGIGRAVKDLLSPSKFLLSYAIDGVKNGDKLSKIISSINGFMGKLKSSITGIISVAGGTAVLYDSFKKANEEGWNLNNTIGTLGGTFATFAGAIKIGWEFGGEYGAIIGAIAGAVITLTTAIIASNEALSPQEQAIKKVNDAVKEYNKSMKELEIETDKQLTSNLLQTQYTSNLVDELNDLVDANGNIKSGYEDRVNFILNELNQAYGTEYKIIDGQVQGYKNLQEEIKRTIQQKEAEYYLDKLMLVAEKARANKDKLQSALVEAENNLANAKINVYNSQNTLNDAQNRYNELLKYNGPFTKEYADALNSASKELSTAQQNQKKANETLDAAQSSYKNAAKAVEENNKKITSYEDLKTAVLSGDYDVLEAKLEEYKNVYIDSSGNIIKAADNEFLLTTQSKKKEYDELKKQNKQLYDDNLNTLVNSTKAVTDITDDQAAAWAALALSDTEAFMTNFKTLPTELQSQIVDKMKQKGIDIGTQLQEGINENTPKVNVNSGFNSYGFKTDVEAFLSRNKSVFSTVGIVIPTLKYAQGGLPPVGQMFIANERGPELVGQIGGKSFVANQNQMMDLLDKKISNAGGLQNATFIIQVGDEKVSQKVLKDLNNMAKSNGKPITITG